MVSPRRSCRRPLPPVPSRLCGPCPRPASAADGGTDRSRTILRLAQHHASEGQRMKLVGVNLLEKLLMTTAAPAKRYMSMIIGGLCHKSGWPVRPSETSYWLTDRKWWHKPLMIIHMYCLTGAAVVIGSCSRIQLRSHHSHHRWPEPVWEIL